MKVLIAQIEARVIEVSVMFLSLVDCQYLLLETPNFNNFSI